MAVIEGARFGHVNVTGRDWRALATFYGEVFGMVQVGPDRDVQGDDFDRATGLTGAHMTGAHLRLPGLGDDGPTLEIFQYEALQDGLPPAVDRPGWGHIAFQVPDVAAARDAFLAAGGDLLGDAVTMATRDGRHVTWCYVVDPAGNIVELQAWS
jgi:catechol 2,3-dioxygenase-like lactoylglutathione lyase family enzyme